MEASKTSFLFAPPFPLSEWETMCNNFFLKIFFLLLNKQEIFTLVGHKKSCFPELIILSKDLAQIAEVTTMTFCQTVIQKNLNMSLQNFKEKSTKEDQEWVKEVLDEEKHVGVYFKEFHNITYGFLHVNKQKVVQWILKVMLYYSNKRQI